MHARSANRDCEDARGIGTSIGGVRKRVSSSQVSSGTSYRYIMR